MIELNPTIVVNRENVLLLAGCRTDSPVYLHVCEEYEKCIKNIVIEPKILIKFQEDKVYVLISAGGQISDYAEELMTKGEALSGLLVNAYGDEAVFELDTFAAQYIKEECARLRKGIKKRLEAPENMPMEKHTEICKVFNGCGISVTDAYMFRPQKTMGYILELTDDKAVFNAQHNCAVCKAVDCPMRKNTDDKFEVLTEYTASKTRLGKSVIGIDIGTTTLAFEQITADGKRFFSTDINAQRRFGTDVLSRIEAASHGRGNEMREAVIYQLICGVRKLINDSKSVPQKIVISGNTAMIHLLMGYPCDKLGVYPFTPYSTDTVHTTFTELTGSKLYSIDVDIICSLSAFVGGDIVSGLYACNLDVSDKIMLFIDLGTNGEMAIGNKEKILTASTAAGPAFEGGKIRHGTGSVEGAVCGVELEITENTINKSIKTINDKPSVGICGTGIIEAVASLLECSLMDETGLLKDVYFENGFRLADNALIYQSDIREIQIAKSAICTGIELLVKEYGIEYSDIDRVLLAGAFGNGLNPQKACAIGLIPWELSEKTVPVGNTALGGAMRYAFGDDGKKRTENIQKISQNIQLTEKEQFNELYLKNMNFKQRKD